MVRLCTCVYMYVHVYVVQLSAWDRLLLLLLHVCTAVGIWCMRIVRFFGEAIPLFSRRRPLRRDWDFYGAVWCVQNIIAYYPWEWFIEPGEGRKAWLHFRCKVACAASAEGDCGGLGTTKVIPYRSRSINGERVGFCIYHVYIYILRILWNIYVNNRTMNLGYMWGLRLYFHMAAAGYVW